MDGGQAALRLRDDGGGELGLRVPADLAPEPRRPGRVLHHHPQGLAPALRRDGLQLPAAHRFHRLRRQPRHHAATGPAGHVPAAARERAEGDGLPRHAATRGPDGFGGGGEDGEQDRGREEEVISGWHS